MANTSHGVLKRTPRSLLLINSFKVIECGAVLVLPPCPLR
ncbi:hypothetical protein F442_14825 [Phytophthora nicotianae P10297]|uniref:Uncharacterized protein n=2 Tax=Phytophthora nicotianae TaxID=4792 RepID=W2PVL3_PHYN3|nr:hypothetical protein PPTG_23691 [Phytophthora nicotianae INRA-310]ETN04065.1 hypothetical protein PPTG_23691 [Phytophthora nicotianae INRA-310]ETP37364.1 hypothetical protein F442_14825 [Phytophthora nicotianae P10297]